MNGGLNEKCTLAKERDSAIRTIPAKSHFNDDHTNTHTHVLYYIASATHTYKRKFYLNRKYIYLVNFLAASYASKTENIFIKYFHQIFTASAAFAG